MTREEAIHELQEDKALYETDICHASDGSPDGDLLEALDMVIEALKADTVEIVRCKDCRHANACHKGVQYIRNEPNTVTVGCSPIEWCSRGERSE